MGNFVTVGGNNVMKVVYIVHLIEFVSKFKSLLVRDYHSEKLSYILDQTFWEFAIKPKQNCMQKMIFAERSLHSFRGPLKN